MPSSFLLFFLPYVVPTHLRDTHSYTSYSDNLLFSYLLNFRKFFPTRPEGAEAPSPGHRPGLLRAQTCRPVRAKALKYRDLY